MPINKIKFVILISFFSTSLFGQINTYSPYSRVGLGELTKPGYGQTLSMGTGGVAYRSNKAINSINPASYTALDTLSFLFDFGFTGNGTNYQTDSLSSQLRNMNFHHISIAFPITRWMKASVGINPYSSVGYKIVDQVDDNSNTVARNYYFEGNGGLNQFYLGTSVVLKKKLSIGLNISYLFGYMNYLQRTEFPGQTDFGRPIVDNRTTVKGAVYTLGFQYHETLNDKYFLTLGGTYNSKTNLNGTKSLTVQNYFPGVTNSFQNDDTLSVISPTNEIAQYDSTGSVGFPQSYALGLAFGINEKLTIMGDYQTQNWSNISIFGKNGSLVNSNSMKLGLEYIPNYGALRGYFNKVHYRLGGYYSNTYIRILGDQLQDYGITFGVGLPFKGTKTTFNLGMVLGQRGTTENNLIKENYGIINVSLTLHDFWFLKRKFD